MDALYDWIRVVFIEQFDFWIILGFFAQAMFMMRFVIQWVASERVGRSIVPVAFWFFSIAGGSLLLVYAIQRQDPVFIAGAWPADLFPKPLADLQGKAERSDDLMS
jgi:lipid-A-disaccharide synthase-like uncharacterized protein